MECCGICLDTVAKTKITVSCGHEFCATCLVQWWNVRATCPVCRNELPSFPIHIRRLIMNAFRHNRPTRTSNQLNAPQVPRRYFVFHSFYFRLALIQAILSIRQNAIHLPFPSLAISIIEMGLLLVEGLIARNFTNLILGRALGSLYQTVPMIANILGCFLFSLTVKPINQLYPVLDRVRS